MSVCWEMIWSEEGQVFGNSISKYTKTGPINTNPSHDLCHLLVAVQGTLPWLPSADRSTSCLAEYNAVFLEHLFNNSCPTTQLTAAIALEKARTFMQWFVETHFAPFPCKEPEAFTMFSSSFDMVLLTRLFPYYGQLRWQEMHDSSYREKTYRVAFTSADDPLQTMSVDFPIVWLSTVAEVLHLVKSA